jgi:hypothetical protein
MQNPEKKRQEPLNQDVSMVMQQKSGLLRSKKIAKVL